MRRLNVICRVLVFLVAALGACVVLATNLIPCPDCENPVSFRAVMCPLCGCPGDAIAEEFARLQAEQAEAPPASFVLVRTDKGEGFAVAVHEAHRGFLVMDAFLLADTGTLSLSTLSTAETVPYRNMQVARDTPLVRFTTDFEDLVFRVPAPAVEYAEALWITPAGDTQPFEESSEAPAAVVALIDGDERLAAIRGWRNPEAIYRLPQERDWQDVAPAVFRAQMGILLAAETEAARGNMTETTVEILRQTQWISPFMARQVEEIIAQDKEGRE